MTKSTATHKRSANASNSTPAQPLIDSNDFSAAKKIKVSEPVPEAFNSHQGHTLFTKPWWKEVISRDSFWQELSDHIPTATLQKRLRIPKPEVTFVLNLEQGQKNRAAAQQRRRNNIDILQTPLSLSATTTGLRVDTQIEKTTQDVQQELETVAELKQEIKEISEIKQELSLESSLRPFDASILDEFRQKLAKLKGPRSNANRQTEYVKIEDGDDDDGDEIEVVET